MHDAVKVHGVVDQYRALLGRTKMLARIAGNSAVQGSRQSFGRRFNCQVFGINRNLITLRIDCHDLGSSSMLAEWKTLVGNFACVALIISAWMHLGYRLYRLSKVQQQACLGAVLGFACIASMGLSIQLDKGIFLDLRLSMIAASAIFGGPLSVLVTSSVSGLFRLYLGGAGAPIGLLGISMVAVLTLLAGRVLRRFGAGDGACILSSGLLSAVLSVAVLKLLPAELSQRALEQLGLQILVANFAATAAAGTAICYFRSFTNERDILHAALTQAPDFHYVKDLQGRFVVTNLNVARHHGRTKTSEMHGLSDFDLEPDERARQLYEEEQQILRSGMAIDDHEERIERTGGQPRWYSTSKIPLKNRQGDLIGISGVTIDITEPKRMAQELQASRDLLARAMSQMSDGLAMFDENGFLIFCNKQYSALFPRSAYARVPGAHITDIVRAVARNGERGGLPTDASEELIRGLAATLHTSKDEFVHLCDDRWLSLRTRVGEDGSAMVVASDVTLMKRSEEALRRMALEMKDLSATDSLTGLSNRRALDEALERDTAEARGTGSPLSLLLLDVDRFKAFNDTYGHTAGDDCLRRVGQVIGQATRRKSDTTARYGGEEFCLILPQTALDDAVAIADRIRQSIRELAIQHDGSEAGLVTVSIGVVCVHGNVGPSVPADMLKTADAALYKAKRLGRDRTEVVEEEVKIAV